MDNDQLINRIGMALIAAGHALVGTAKFETKSGDAQKLAEETSDKIRAGEATPEEPPKPKRKRRTKAEIEAEKAAAAAVEEPESDDFSDVEPDAPKVTEDTLKKALVAHAKEKGKDSAFKILKKYKAKKVADLDPSLYAEVYEQVAVNA